MKEQGELLRLLALRALKCEKILIPNLKDLKKRTLPCFAVNSKTTFLIKVSCFGVSGWSTANVGIYNHLAWDSSKGNLEVAQP